MRTRFDKIVWSNFEHQSMVTIGEFKIRVEYSMAWEQGPWIVQSISRKLRGKYAAFFDIEEFSLINNQQFKWANDD